MFPSTAIRTIGKNKTKNNVSEIERSRIIKRTLGVQVAARYLKARGWSIEASLHILARIN